MDLYSGKNRAQPLMNAIPDEQVPDIRGAGDIVMNHFDHLQMECNQLGRLTSKTFSRICFGHYLFR